MLFHTCSLPDLLRALRDPISTTLLEQIGCILRDDVFPSLLLPRLSTPCYHLSWSVASLLLHIQHSFRLPACLPACQFRPASSLPLTLPSPPPHQTHGPADCVTSDSYNFCVFSLVFSSSRSLTLSPRAVLERRTLSLARTSFVICSSAGVDSPRCCDPLTRLNRALNFAFTFPSVEFSRSRTVLAPTLPLIAARVHLSPSFTLTR